ncbi:MAG TPA: hypothetical protein VI389_07230, partial [Geobacteraceae bacterium]
MPIDVFDAISGNIRSFLGGAEVDLVPSGEGASLVEKVLHIDVTIEERPYLFTASRPALPFTLTEEVFCRELLAAFSGLYSGFRQEGYAAHFRTALLASIMDIAVARFLRGDVRKGFWPIQQLIQLLKNLSYQRYEGKPATTGFIVYRTTLPALRKLVRQRQHTFIPLRPSQGVSPDFFANPLTYRFVDGANLVFVATIEMDVTGVIRTGNATTPTDVERVSQRELFYLVRHAGDGAFAITVNEASEIEVLINPDKLLVRRKGLWGIFDPDIFRSFLAGSLDAAAIDDLLWTVYALSKIRHGTVILVHNRGARQLAALKKGSVGGDDPVGRLLIGRVKGRTITDLKEAGALLRILSADGMTVFNEKGRLQEAGFIIDTSHAREVVTG